LRDVIRRLTISADPSRKNLCRRYVCGGPDTRLAAARPQISSSSAGRWRRENRGRPGCAPPT
jgi:hypothetical protein